MSDGDKAVCGGIANGKPICRTGDIQRELDSRLQQKPSNAKVSGERSESA